MPETSRKLEYTADISVRCDGFTDIRKGRPPQISNRTRKREPVTSIATVAQGHGETSAARMKHPPPRRKPERTALRTEWRCIQRSISGATNKPALASEVAKPPT